MTEYNFYISNKEIQKATKDSLNSSWKTTTKASLIMCILCLLPLTATVLLSVFVKWWISIPMGLFSLYVFAFFRYGFANYCLKLARQELPVAKEIFAGFKHNFKSIIALTTKKIFLSLFWIVLLVFPFFVKAIGYSMSTLLLIDRTDISSANALQESMHIMKQNYSRYFKMLLSNIGWYLLILISAGIAYLWVNAILQTKKAVFYENLKTDF